jgi:hypothetical protein
VLWVLTHGGFQPTPSGPNDGRIIAAYEQILKGIETLSRADESAHPSIQNAQRAPGMSAILSGIRTLRAAGRQNRQRPIGRSKR